MPIFLLLKYWKAGVLVLVVAGALSYLAYLKHEITRWHNEAIGLQTKLDSCNAAKLLLDSMVKDQNAAIARADAEAKAKITEASSEATLKVIAARQDTIQALKALHSSKVPHSCIEAVRHANVHAKELSQW